MARSPRLAHVEQEIRRAWTYVGVPELRSAYDPPFEEVPHLALPYVSVQLSNGRDTTPRIDSRLCPSRPYCIFPREVFEQLRIDPERGVRARDPDQGELRLILLELKVFGDGGGALSTRARLGWPVEKDAPEPILGSFGFFSAFEVDFSPRHGITIRPAAPRS
jgi:hypothetical protein